MKEVRVENLNSQAQEVYERFERQAGSDHIASLWAIQVLFEILQSDKPKTILEFGGGIGTLSYLCLKYSDAKIDIYENNDFCIGVLKKNLKGFEGRYTLLTDYSDARLPHKSYNLVICDGGPYNLVREIVNNTKNIKRLFFEGKRNTLQGLFRKALRGQYVLNYTKYRHANYEEKGGRCGYNAVCKPHNGRIIRYASYARNEYEFLEDMERGLLPAVKAQLKKVPFVRYIRRIKSNNAL